MRTTTTTTCAILVALIASTTARADQCELVDDAVASKAVKALAGSLDVIQFCEPCGDKAPGEPARATRVEKTRDATGDYEVVIDRREVDLAYTYVKTSPSHYENVAALAGCPTSGVSPSLRVDDATATGVMIHADSTPVVAEPISAQTPPTTPVVVVQPVDPVNWLRILLLCCSTSAAWGIGTLAILRRRRRHTMRPRAVEMIDRSRPA